VIRIPVLLALLLLGACSSPSDSLVVKQFLLRDQIPRTADEPMARMEKSRRLRGAVSLEERRQRLGQYYTLIWHDTDGAGHGDVELVFQYQQGATASLVKRMTRRFSADTTHGKAEFAIIGDDFFKNGKVLTWKATLLRGGREMASQQSYLWR
jgi:uncharacterized protein YcfL